MDFITFQAEKFKKDFTVTIKELLATLKSSDDKVSINAIEMIAGVNRSIDVMERASVDAATKNGDTFKQEDVTEVGNNLLLLLDELSIVAANRGMHQCMLSLQELSMPVAMWIADNAGLIDKLDVVVNSIAGYANKLTDAKHLSMFCETIQKVVYAVTDEIKMDMEATNPMRPWRIMNLNWGIVATRSHDVEKMEMVFSQLIKNIPADARQFFKEGMQQMDVIDYPQAVKELVGKYNALMSKDENLH